ncbi:hypothetical protein [Rhabdothermincola salaria]|uniref:hypothetical protein n=1 Tax=Rhabdothermincola salaria TaxID=2903142 RepID=UPI001E5D40F6|nr:hypothetical protein [Rhabdothermincola salaria]MCD9624832.1 hypothetical protein [Rhabdothermincola salaria]
MATEADRGDLTDHLLMSSVWSDEDVAAAGIPIVDRTVVTVGGGMGSFFVANLLRTSGMGVDEIVACSGNEEPHETYEFLADNSQIPRHERLRSDSQAMPDNLWGFPSFAWREARQGYRKGLWQVLTEPVIAEYFTPSSGVVYAGVAAEAARIGWSQMLARGQVRMVRRRFGGGYFTLLTPPPRTTPTKRVAYRSRYVHVAIGYPGARYLPDLQDYRTRTGDHIRVVNAYERHEHVYRALASGPRRVVVRGSGIVASRILQRLLDDRETGRSEVEVIHLFRSYADEGSEQGPPPRRRTHLGFAYQPFNLPKSAFGGQLADELEAVGDPHERARILGSWAGTTTAWRHSWVTQLERCLRTGSYRQVVGEVASVDRHDDRLMLTLTGADGRSQTIEADFIIDGTGLQADASDHRVLKDLMDHSGVELNPMRRLSVEPNFELSAAAQPPGRIFATGSMTLGSYYSAVDSFFGLEFAAWRVVDTVAADGSTRRIGPRRSVSQWIRRMRGVAP